MMQHLGGAYGIRDATAEDHLVADALLGGDQEPLAGQRLAAPQRRRQIVDRGAILVEAGIVQRIAGLELANRHMQTTAMGPHEPVVGVAAEAFVLMPASGNQVAPGLGHEAVQVEQPRRVRFDGGDTVDTRARLIEALHEDIQMAKIKPDLELVRVPIQDPTVDRDRAFGFVLLGKDSADHAGHRRIVRRQFSDPGDPSSGLREIAG